MGVLQTPIRRALVPADVALPDTDTDGDGTPDCNDTDDDNDGVLDGVDTAPLDP